MSLNPRYRLVPKHLCGTNTVAEYLILYTNMVEWVMIALMICMYTQIYTYVHLKSKIFYASCDILDHNYYKWYWPPSHCTWNEKSSLKLILNIAFFISLAISRSIYSPWKQAMCTLTLRSLGRRPAILVLAGSSWRGTRTQDHAQEYLYALWNKHFQSNPDECSWRELEGRF